MKGCRFLSLLNNYEFDRAAGQMVSKAEYTGTSIYMMSMDVLAAAIASMPINFVFWLEVSA